MTCVHESKHSNHYQMYNLETNKKCPLVNGKIYFRFYQEVFINFKILISITINRFEIV